MLKKLKDIAASPVRKRASKKRTSVMHLNRETGTVTNYQGTSVECRVMRDNRFQQEVEIFCNDALGAGEEVIIVTSADGQFHRGKIVYCETAERSKYIFSVNPFFFRAKVVFSA